MTDSVEKLSARVALLADKVGYEMHNFDCGQIDNTVIEPETEEITTNFTLEQVIRAVTSAFNEQVASAVATAKQEALLLAHPVNSYYWSSEATDPAELFGGTWVAVIDKFIYASGTHEAGETGGEETHTLVESELPVIDGEVGCPVPENHGSFVSGHFRALKYTSGVSVSVDMGSNILYGYGYRFGSGGSHNNMPPYEVAHCWRRTA